MLIKTFWNLLIKIIGLLILLSFISIIPQFSTTLSLIKDDFSIENLMLPLALIIFYFLLVRFLLFKTDWIIEKLKLEKNFTEEKIDIKIESITVLTISIIVIGGLILVDAIPSLFSNLFSFFQQKILLKDYPQTSWLIFHLLKVIIGYLLLTNGKNLAKYIEKESLKE